MKQRGFTYLEMLLMYAMLSLVFLMERGFGLLGDRGFVPAIDGVAVALVVLGIVAVVWSYRQSQKRPETSTEPARQLTGKDCENGTGYRH